MKRTWTIEAVAFDLDDTLLDRRRSFERFVRGQWERFAGDLGTVPKLQYVQTLIARDRDGYSPRRDLFAGALQQFGLPVTLGDTLLRDYRARFPSACVLFPDVAATLATLRARGFALGLITNGSARMQRAKLQALALAPAFDAVLISDVEGVSKPDREIFQRALTRLDTKADRAVFVGDHPQVDMAGARAAGMKAIWRRDPLFAGPAKADAVIDELGDLLRVLGVGRRDTDV